MDDSGKSHFFGLEAIIRYRQICAGSEMADNKEQPSQGRQQQAAGQQQGQGEGPSASLTPLQARQLRHARARRYNKQHAGESAEFQRLTGLDPMNIFAIVQWQSRRGLKADGKIGLQTIEAASAPGGALVASAGPIMLPGAQKEPGASVGAAQPMASGTAAAAPPPAATAVRAAAPERKALGPDETAEQEVEVGYDLHHDPRVKQTDDIIHLGKPEDHEEHEAIDEHDVDSVGRVRDKSYPQELVQVPHGYGGKKVELTPETAAAYEALLSHARAAGFQPPLFTIFSAWRSDAHQAGIMADADKKHPGENNRKWVAKPGGSAHRTGHAIDFWMGINNQRENVEEQRRSKPYLWLKENAASFGFSPYDAEPWHWEFNPKGDKL